MRAIDLFAGAGGFTAGAHMAGVNVVWAANHWPLAVETHQTNHPDAEHVCQDLHQANWAQVPAHDLMLASPACQGHSKARGKDEPHHDETRSTAWAVVSAAEYHSPECVVVENVPEFFEWRLYGAWAAAMQALGYTLSPHVIDSADHGVPQHRVRAFIIATKSSAPLLLQLPQAQHVGIGQFIQWDADSWSEIEKPGRSDKTLARIASGRARCGDRFVMPYYGNGSGLTGRDINRPLGTVTTRDRWGLVDGERMRMLNVAEYTAAMGFPADYALPTTRAKAIHLLGNAVCPPVARDLITEIGRAA